MKKSFVIWLALLICALFAGNANAAGRLNFMLVNLTGQEISDVQICPTYFPKYLSNNLLKTALAPDSRIYFGPDYYGEQKNWDIKLKWANGYEQTFPNLQLTKYNCYTAYNTPTGVHMRQTYDPSLANAEPFAPSYEMGDTIKIAVSQPEKVVVVDQAADRGQVSKPGQDTLIFEEGVKGAPILKDAQAEKIKGETKALKTTVAVTRDGKTTMAQPGEKRKVGDKAELKYVANANGNIYWLVEIAPGEFVVLYPADQKASSAAIKKNTEYSVPQKPETGAKAGSENYTTIFSSQPVPEMEKALQLYSEGKTNEANAVVADIVKDIAKKREAGEILFEEETNGAIDTRSQTGPANEPFVEGYELIFD